MFDDGAAARPVRFRRAIERRALCWLKTLP
jgi:hypothetical protein